jgi:deazaflavin-dependent oxidoreductase (nitroreductase family)
LLTTTGISTGNRHTTPLLFGQDGDRYLAVASRKGADRHPQWYLNLEAFPNVDVQVLGDKFAAVARTASDREKPALWQKMLEVWPEYDDYQARTERVIPVVIVERAEPRA